MTQAMPVNSKTPGETMAQNSAVPALAEPTHYDLNDLLVAYDFSEAADAALKYAKMLAQRFGSFIHLLGVQTPTEYSRALEGGPLAMELSERNLQLGLKLLEEHLRSEGIWSDSLRRIGNVADTVEGSILERRTDLLVIGAFGYGRIDRPRLGSTAEHLLRIVRCPVLVIGPHALPGGRDAPPIKRILCAMTTVEPPDNTLPFAGHLAAQMGASLEVVHVIDPTYKHVPRKESERRCEAWAVQLRERGVPVAWTVIHGQIDQAIAARAATSKSSLILFGLHRIGNKTVDCADGVVSATIREAHCPVMTVPSNFSL
jgi:nucleotide-binding universal stress UspA family protein